MLSCSIPFILGQRQRADLRPDRHRRLPQRAVRAARVVLGGQVQKHRFVQRHGAMRTLRRLRGAETDCRRRLRVRRQGRKDERRQVGTERKGTLNRLCVVFQSCQYSFVIKLRIEASLDR